MIKGNSVTDKMRRHIALCRPVLFLVILLGSCSNSGLPQPRTALLTKEQSVKIAIHEIAHRRIVLPRNYTTRTKKEVMREELVGNTPVFDIYFDVPDAHQGKNLYVISVNRRDGKVEFFTDTQKQVPEAKYSIEINDQPDRRRFEIKVTSRDTRPICMESRQWPNRRGELDARNTVAILRTERRSFDLHPDGPGTRDDARLITLAPGEAVVGFVGYSVFGNPDEIAKLSERKLVFVVGVVACH